MATYNNYYWSGTVQWCKLLPDQLVLNYNKDGREWQVDFHLDNAAIKDLKKEKLEDRLKQNDQGMYLRLKQNEINQKTGEAMKPVKIVDEDNQPWDGRRLGNGTRVDAKISVADNGPGKKKSIYLQAIRVRELVPFEERDDFPPIEGKAKVQRDALDDILDPLDDDFPI